MKSELPKAAAPPWAGSLLTRCRDEIRLVQLALVQLMAMVRAVNCSCAAQAF